MIIAFFVCWLPYTTLSVVVVADPELYIPPLLATMPMYFAKTSPVYNPIIYFLSNKQVSFLKSQSAVKTELQMGRRLIYACWYISWLIPWCVSIPNSSVTPPWRCCRAAATSPTGPPPSASTCAPWTGGPVWLPWARASTRTARCCLCDFLQQQNKKPPWLSSVYRCLIKDTGLHRSPRKLLSENRIGSETDSWYSEGGQNEWKLTQ